MIVDDSLRRVFVTAIGQHISHYQILEKLGEGGMGIVYKAQDLKLNRTVALKFLPSVVGKSESELKRFHQEANALSSLNHSSIATIYDIDEAEGQRFIALEYLPGGTLRSKLRSAISSGEELSIEQIVDYGLQVALGLSHAHTHSVIHRDVKTENIMLTGEGKVKITDFGLAKLRGESSITRTGSAVGTAAYMSPEQVRGEEIDERSDIFSLGVVLYELTTGRLPFRGEHEAALTYSIVNSDPIGLPTLRQDVPDAVQRLILKCLEKEKPKRYQKCDEITAELEHIQGELTGTVQAAESSSRKSKGFWVAAVIGGISVFAAVVYFLILPSAKPPASLSPSIAVLYVENMTEKESFNSFAAGMTEEIINELANVPGVQVVSRSDVMPYQKKPVNIQEIGEKLGVSYVLESSVRAEGNKVRITCQAIQTADRFHFWSQAYTKELTSALDVQSDVAKEIALGLKTKFTQKEVERQLGLPTNSLIK